MLTWQRKSRLELKVGTDWIFYSENKDDLDAKVHKGGDSNPLLNFLLDDTPEMFNESDYIKKNEMKLEFSWLTDPNHDFLNFSSVELPELWKRLNVETNQWNNSI